MYQNVVRLDILPFFQYSNRDRVLILCPEISINNIEQFWNTSISYSNFQIKYFILIIFLLQIILKSINFFQL